MFFFLLVLLIVIVVLLAQALHVVPDNRRLAVFRLGRLRGVVGPGVVLTIPALERAVPVSLDSRVPGWQGLDEESIRRQVLTLVEQTPDLNTLAA